MEKITSMDSKMTKMNEKVDAVKEEIDAQKRATLVKEKQCGGVVEGADDELNEEQVDFILKNTKSTEDLENVLEKLSLKTIENLEEAYLIIVADAVSVNFSGRSKFLQI